MSVKKQYASRTPAQEIKASSNKSKIRDIDHKFLFLVMIMLFIGLVMLLSASAPTGSTKFNNPYHFIIKQLRFVVVGLVLMFVLARCDYRVLKKTSGLFMFVCVVALFLVLTPLGTELNGSQRWIFGIQPSEFTKMATAMYCAYMLEQDKFDISKKKGIKETLKALIPFMVILGAVTAFMMLETHMSGCIIILSIAAVIILTAGLDLKLFYSLGGALGIAGFIFARSDAERWARVVSFRDPFADIKGEGYQVVQGLYAIAAGGLFGRGLGQSIQKSTYLPEPYNDFIFTIICEELGAVGVIAIMLLFVAIIWRGLHIAFHAPDKFGTFVTVGIMAQIGIQTIFNIAVATSSIPCTGVALPFFSYGGSSILVLLAEMGLILSVSRYSVQSDMETPQ